MAVNLDKPHLWKKDTEASVDYYNRWFMKFAPKAFRETRKKVTAEVEQAIIDSNYLLDLSVDLFAIETSRFKNFAHGLLSADCRGPLGWTCLYQKIDS